MRTNAASARVWAAKPARTASRMARRAARSGAAGTGIGRRIAIVNLCRMRRGGGLCQTRRTARLTSRAGG
jgi:hypothetical protein